MDAVAVEQMNMMLKVGIKTQQIYSPFVHTIEGFQNVPFLKRDIYNQIGKQRRLRGGDAMSCLKFLESIVQENPGMYLADKDGRLSPLHDLEMSASNKLTKEIFFLFSPMLFRTCTLKVQTHTLSQTCDIYTLSKSINARKEWQVCRYCDSNIFKCSCLRMESLGIPCDHIVAVLIHVELSDISDSLVLDRWSKNACYKIRAFVEKAPFCWDSTITFDAE
ncbi:hypothetical protein HN51_021854 [Arachis hypogaea]